MVVKNLKVIIQSNNIINDISFTLNDGDKIGLVGNNGSGKTTLLKALSNNLPYIGSIKLNTEQVDYLKQEISYIYNELTVIQYIKQVIGIDSLENKLYELENNLTEDNMDCYSDTLNKYLALDGYNFTDNLNIILNGLNFKESSDMLIKYLSGGEKIKILLACLLLSNKDILLLDEPTNNLDLDAINWLERYLRKSTKKMIIVSHDEMFLNSIVNKVFELNNGKILEYNMKYNDYLKEKEKEYNNQLEEYKKIIQKRDKLKQQLEKTKVWASKGNNKKSYNDNDKIANNYAKERTNNSNISKISKALTELEIPYFKEKKELNFFFNLDTDKGNKDIFLNNLVCGYNNFKTPTINISIPYGSKIQICGSNGSGKTTLVRTILNEIEPLSGEVILGSSVKIGYISQDTLNGNTNDTVLKYLTKDIKDYDLSMIFTLLDKFNISYDDKDKPYNILSPGQRTRVNLVKIALSRINVLILDEVTNHLDKEAIDLIYELISTYQGTIISISHNRKYNDILNASMLIDISTGNIEYKNSDNIKQYRK